MEGRQCVEGGWCDMGKVRRGGVVWCVEGGLLTCGACAAGVYTVDDPTIVKLDQEVRAAMQRGGLS